MLDKLAALLPDFSEFNTEDQKWTKAQIVENSIKFIKKLQNAQNTSVLNDDQQQHADSAKIIKILKKQNKKLREVLKNEFAPHMTDKDFAHLDFNTLEKLVKEKNHDKLRDKPKENDQNALNDAGDVFVVSTEARRSENCDHNYSVVVHAEAEIEIGEDGDNIQQHQDNNVIDDLVVLESSTEPSVIGKYSILIL